MDRFINKAILKLTGGEVGGNTRDEFIKPFNTKEVKKKFQNPRVIYNENNEQESYEFYRMNLKGRLSYDITYEIAKKRFYFFLSSENNGKMLELATLIFNPISNEKGFIIDKNKRYLEMSHRSVSTKDAKISGSDFYKKAEEYLTILNKEKLLSTTTIAARVFQPTTFAWFEKNGFKFNKGNTRNREDYFEVKNGKVILQSGFSLTSVKVVGDEAPRDEYIINQNFLNDEKFTEEWNKYLVPDPDIQSKSRFVFPDNEKGTEIIEQLITAGYIPVFLVEKDLDI